MDVSGITTQQRVYKPLVVPSSVSKSGLKSLSCLRSWAYTSRLENWSLVSGVGIYTYPGGMPLIWIFWAPGLSPGGACGVPCGGRAGCWGGAHVALHLQGACGFFAGISWHGWQLSVWFSWTMTECLSITAFTFLLPGISTPPFFSSHTLVWVFLIRYCIPSIAAHKNPPWTIFAIFKARRMLDCSSCTRPPCFAILAHMSITQKTFVAASENEIRQLPLPAIIP